MHSGGLELTKLTYSRHEDNLLRHRSDYCIYILRTYRRLVLYALRVTSLNILDSLVTFVLAFQSVSYNGTTPLRTSRFIPGVLVHHVIPTAIPVTRTCIGRLALVRVQNALLVVSRHFRSPKKPYSPFKVCLKTQPQLYQLFRTGIPVCDTYSFFFFFFGTLIRTARTRLSIFYYIESCPRTKPTRTQRRQKLENS